MPDRAAMMRLPVGILKAEISPVLYVFGDCALDSRRHAFRWAAEPIWLRYK